MNTYEETGRGSTAADVVREEWQRAVSEFGLRPGSPTEAVVSRILERLTVIGNVVRCPKRNDGYGCRMVVVACDSGLDTIECAFCLRRLTVPCSAKPL